MVLVKPEGKEAKMNGTLILLAAFLIVVTKCPTRSCLRKEQNTLAYCWRESPAWWKPMESEHEDTEDGVLIHVLIFFVGFQLKTPFH